MLAEVRPDWVLVQGDTTTVMAAALLAYYHHIRVGHVEAGLRTGDKWQPFPEEINRRVAGAVADLHFAPTAWARDNLLREGVPPERVIVTGNPVIDALQDVAAAALRLPRRAVWLAVPYDRRLVLVTAHRRENFGPPLEAIFTALRRLAEIYPATMPHSSTRCTSTPTSVSPAHRMLGGRAPTSA